MICLTKNGPSIVNIAPLVFFFFNDTATTEIYTLSLHDALPIYSHAKRLLRSPRMLSSARSYSACCASCRANGSAAITWQEWASCTMRVIAGTYRSRILKSLKGLALRPTSDRLRETLFNVLGPGVTGSRFVDLFAGTGAIGIEALSRGAAHVVFVENHPPAAALIRRNLELLQIRKGASLITSDALRGLQTLAS